MKPTILLALTLMSTTTAARQASFDAWLAGAHAAPVAERQAAVEALWQRTPQTPLIEGDSTAVFLYRGEAASVGLHGDMSRWDVPLPLERIEGTDLWYRRAAFESGARLEYVFLVDTELQGFGAELAGIPDPRNPHRVPSGFGPFSEVVMPAYEYPEVFAAVRDGRTGTSEGLHAHVLPAGVLPYEHEVLVYVPPDNVGGERLPAAYFGDGRDYVEFAHVPAVLDCLIEQGEIEPLIAVFVDPPNRHVPASPNRMTEYGMNEDFVTFLADELVPFVDGTYATRAEPHSRLIVGDSYGGLMAVFAAFLRSDVFGLAYSQSGYHSFQDDRLIRMVASEPVAPIRLFLDVGTYETKVGSGLIPDAEADFLAASRRLRQALLERGYEVEYAEYPEGHTWGNWRAHLIDGLVHFFPPQAD